MIVDCCVVKLLCRRHCPLCGCETVPCIPLWEAIYAHHRPQATHCHFPPRKASSCHDLCETPAICIVLGWFRLQDRVVVVDADSKWPEVISVSSTTSSSTIEVICSPGLEFLNRSLATMVHNLSLRSSRRSSGPMASAI